MARARLRCRAEAEPERAINTAIVPSSWSRGFPTIAFAYDDLAAVLKLAQVAHNVYGGECTTVQLASATKATPTSGACGLKVAGARLYRVFEGSGSEVRVTNLGVAALDEANTGARADAFRNVPLNRALYDEFHSRNLPDDAGLEARIRALGVSTKQVTTARPGQH